ncbi:MAG: signal peptidase I [Lachnospiraceae bacterium]|nr:signal peptidase I [Lachnospiraceae bacterium]
MEDNKDLLEKAKEQTPDAGSKPSESQDASNKKGKIISEIASWAIIIGIALILATLINTFVIIKAEVISGSMLDTLQINDVFLGSRLSYVFGEPERGEIVFFKFPDNEEETFVKRVIGLPGEKLEIKDGKVYINDSAEPLDEPYLKETPIKEDFGPVTIPEDGYFMMGDNRNHSKDSRAWKTFYVKKDQLLAKAWLRIWPPFKLVEHHNYEEEN